MESQQQKQTPPQAVDRKAETITAADWLRLTRKDIQMPNVFGKLTHSGCYAYTQRRNFGWEYQLDCNDLYLLHRDCNKEAD